MNNSMLRRLCAVIWIIGCLCCICYGADQPAEETSSPDSPETDEVAALNAQLQELKDQHQALLDEFDIVMDIAREDKLPLYRELARNRMAAGKYEEAAEAFENVIILDPRDAAAHYQLGLIYARYFKDKAKAVRYLKRCLSLKPDEKTKKNVQYLTAMLED